MTGVVGTDTVGVYECIYFELTNVWLMGNVSKDNMRFGIRYARFKNRSDIFCRCCFIEKGMRNDVVADHVLWCDR